MKPSLDCDVLIAGGGIFGFSIAYYLLRDYPGLKVLVVDQYVPGKGSTARAAGIISAVRPEHEQIPLVKETLHVAAELEEITGCNSLLSKNGALHLATSEAALPGLEKLISIASEYEIAFEELNPGAFLQNLPWLKTGSSSKAVLFPEEAITDGWQFGQAYAKAARLLGAQVLSNQCIVDLLQDGGIITGAKCIDMVIHAPVVVLATGVWLSKLPWIKKIALPLAPVRSQYWVSDAYPDLFLPNAPTVFAHGARFYSRPMGNSLLFGIREPVSVTLNPAFLPEKTDDFPTDFDHEWIDLENALPSLLPFFPKLYNIGLKMYVTGYSGYTLDKQLIAGRIASIEGLFVAGGCSGSGIALSGGVGLGMAQCITDKPSILRLDVFKPERFGTFDPMSTQHLNACGLMRSGKAGG